MTLGTIAPEALDEREKERPGPRSAFRLPFARFAILVTGWVVLADCAWAWPASGLQMTSAEEGA